MPQTRPLSRPSSSTSRILEATDLLAKIGGGVTIAPAVEGGWHDPQTDTVVWERPVLVYTFVRAEQFIALLPTLRRYLHRLGRETDQGEIAFEFGTEFFRITRFDDP